MHKSEINVKMEVEEKKTYEIINSKTQKCNK